MTVSSIQISMLTITQQGPMQQMMQGQGAPPMQQGGQGGAQGAGMMPPPPPGSAPAQLMEHLRDTQASDPAAFADLTSQISEQLQEAADGLGDSPTAALLSDLSDKFAQASQDGDLSAFGPPPPPPGSLGGPGAAPMGAMPQNLATGLQQLNTQQPALLEQLLGSASDLLSQAAQDPQYASVADLLESLSAQFSNLADSGDLSALGGGIMPPPPMQDAAGAYQQNSGGIDSSVVENVFRGILQGVVGNTA